MNDQNRSCVLTPLLRFLIPSALPVPGATGAPLPACQQPGAVGGIHGSGASPLYPQHGELPPHGPGDGANPQQLLPQDMGFRR